MAAIGLAFKWPAISSSLPASAYTLPTTLKHRAQATLGLFTIASLLVTLYRWPPVPKPHRPGTRLIRAGIWTVHFGIDNEGRDSQRRMRDLIGYVLSALGIFVVIRLSNAGSQYREMELDVVGLLETDLHVSRCAFVRVVVSVH